jgi:hypothetical protein
LYFSGFIQEQNWEAWSQWTTWELWDQHPLFSVTPMNQALLGVGTSSLDRYALSPCSEDEDATFLPVGSNSWESTIIPQHIDERIEDLFSIDTNYNSSLPKNMNVLCPPKKLPQELFNFTQGERLWANCTIYRGNLDELKAVVGSFWITSFLSSYF